MSQESSLLLITAASLAFFHTLFGPDHYLPFIVFAKAKKWTIQKTTSITILCGLAHIVSSVALGFIGIAFGISLSEIELFDGFRGSITAWLLITFGLIYFIYGIKKIFRFKPHSHWHFHDESVYHSHNHIHKSEHLHVHEEKKKNKLTPWILFTIFLFGPCEPLIPILMYPAAQSNMSLLILVIVIFGGITILTMLGLTLMTIYGTNFLKLKRFEKYTHALAGFTILVCGLGMQFLGL